MTPEVAQIGIDKFEKVKNIIPREWKWTDWPDLSTMDVFK